MASGSTFDSTYASVDSTFDSFHSCLGENELEDARNGVLAAVKGVLITPVKSAFGSGNTEVQIGMLEDFVVEAAQSSGVQHILDNSADIADQVADVLEVSGSGAQSSPEEVLQACAQVITENIVDLLPEMDSDDDIFDLDEEPEPEFDLIAMDDSSGFSRRALQTFENNLKNSVVDLLQDSGSAAPEQIKHTLHQFVDRVVNSFELEEFLQGGPPSESVAGRQSSILAVGRQPSVSILSRTQGDPSQDPYHVPSPKDELVPLQEIENLVFAYVQDKLHDRYMFPSLLRDNNYYDQRLAEIIAARFVQLDPQIRSLMMFESNLDDIDFMEEEYVNRVTNAVLMDYQALEEERNTAFLPMQGCKNFWELDVEDLEVEGMTYVPGEGYVKLNQSILADLEEEIIEENIENVPHPEPQPEPPVEAPPKKLEVPTKKTKTTTGAKAKADSLSISNVTVARSNSTRKNAANAAEVAGGYYDRLRAKKEQERVEMEERMRKRKDKEAVRTANLEAVAKERLQKYKNIGDNPKQVTAQRAPQKTGNTAKSSGRQTAVHQPEPSANVSCARGGARSKSQAVSKIDTGRSSLSGAAPIGRTSLGPAQPAKPSASNSIKKQKSMDPEYQKFLIQKLTLENDIAVLKQKKEREAALERAENRAYDALLRKLKMNEMKEQRVDRQMGRLPDPEPVKRRKIQKQKCVNESGNSVRTMASIQESSPAPQARPQPVCDEEGAAAAPPPTRLSFLKPPRSSFGGGEQPSSGLRAPAKRETLPAVIPEAQCPRPQPVQPAPETAPAQAAGETRPGPSTGAIPKVRTGTSLLRKPSTRRSNQF